MEITPFVPNQRSDIEMRGSGSYSANLQRNGEKNQDNALGETIPVKVKAGTNIAGMRKIAQSQLDDLVRSKRKCEVNMYIIDVIRVITWVTTLALCGWSLAAYDGDMMVYAVKHFHNAQCVILKNPESMYQGQYPMANRTKRVTLPDYLYDAAVHQGNIQAKVINTTKTNLNGTSSSSLSRRKREVAKTEDEPKNIFTRTSYRDIVAKVSENFPLIAVLEIMVSICGFMSKKNAQRKIKDVSRRIKERQAILSYGGNKDKRLEQLSRMFQSLLEDGTN